MIGDLAGGWAFRHPADPMTARCGERSFCDTLGQAVQGSLPQGSATATSALLYAPVPRRMCLISVSGFLSKDMTYSCAIFPELDADLRESPPSSVESSPKEGQTPSSTGASTPATLAESDHGDMFKEFSLNVLGLFSHHGNAQHPHDSDAHDPLEAAQFRKLRHIIRKADIRPGHRVSCVHTYTT